MGALEGREGRRGKRAGATSGLEGVLGMNGKIFFGGPNCPREEEVSSFASL